MITNKTHCPICNAVIDFSLFYELGTFNFHCYCSIPDFSIEYHLYLCYENYMERIQIDMKDTYIEIRNELILISQEFDRKMNYTFNYRIKIESFNPDYKTKYYEFPEYIKLKEWKSYLALI